MYSLTVERVICSSHAIPALDNSAAPLHGHNFRFVVEVVCDELDPRGMVVAPGALSRRLWAILEPLDHRHLNDVPPFNEPGAALPSPPVLARYVAEALAARVEDRRVRVRKVTVWSGPDCAGAWER